MKNNNKNTYIIIALICLILVNLVSMAVVLTKNVESIQKDKPFINKIKSMLNIKDLVKEVVSFPFPKNKPKEEENQINKEEKEEDLDMGEDFIIIDTIEEYENFVVVKDPKEKTTIDDVPEPLNIKKINIDETKPYIFIYHTHATEAFETEKGNNYRSKDNAKNMVAIGEIMTKVLEANGHNVMHEQTQHDNPSYNQSYSRSLNTLNNTLEKEKNLRFTFDLHRDGREAPKDPEKYKQLVDSFKMEIDGKSVAKFAMVIGPQTPNYEEVLSLAKYIKAVSDVMYPGLCRGIIVKKYGKFNQFVSDYAALFEMGFNLNTFEEVSETSKLVSEILDIAIENIKE